MILASYDAAAITGQREESLGLWNIPFPSHQSAWCGAGQPGSMNDYTLHFRFHISIDKFLLPEQQILKYNLQLYYIAKDGCSWGEWLGGTELMFPCMWTGCPCSFLSKTVQPFMGCMSESGAEGRLSRSWIILAFKNLHKIKTRSTWHSPGNFLGNNGALALRLHPK